MNACVQPNLVTAFFYHQDELQQFLMRKVNCPDTADDLIQETYLRIARHQSEIGIVNQRAFLYRVACNLAVDHIRSQVRWAQRDGGPVTEDLICPQPQPEHELEGLQEIQRFIQRINDLPPRCRAVFQLCRLEGKSHRQIAGELNLTPRNVERLMQQALQLLKTGN